MAGEQQVRQFLAAVGVNNMDDMGNFLQSMHTRIAESETQRTQLQEQLGATSTAFTDQIQSVQVQFQQQMEAATARNLELQQRLDQALAHLTTVSVQIGDAATRATAAEAERRDALRIAAAATSSGGGGAASFSADGGGIVDNKGVGQPFKLSNNKDQDFAEWKFKFLSHAKARYGHEVERAFEWAAFQKKVVVTVAMTAKQVGWADVFGDAADEIDKIDNLQGKLDGIMSYMVSFTTGEANKIVRNVGSNNTLEAWRKLRAQYDPMSAMRRVTILGLVQSPSKCDSVEPSRSSAKRWRIGLQ